MMILFIPSSLIPFRKQFDLANREAMDESAYWRSRYDEEVKKVSNCQKELLEVCQ